MSSLLTLGHPDGSVSGGPEARPSWDLALWTFLAIAAALLPAMLVASLDFGVTWDESDRHHNGQMVLQFLQGVRSRASFPKTGRLYPGLFDTFCVVLERWLPVDRYVGRHLVNATFGWIGIVYCGRLARSFFGPWAGPLAMVLLALSPRFFADAMNNPKDLPFAATCMVAIFYIAQVSPRWPYVSWSVAAKITLALAVALNVRVGALLYLGYFGLLVMAYAVVDRCADWRRVANVTGRVLVVTVTTLWLGTLFWPWAGGAPLTRPFGALLGAASFPWDGVVLFRGDIYSSGELPWYYAPWWFLITTPPAVLAGVCLSPVLVAGRVDGWRRVALGGIALFPVATSIIMGSTQYDGIRHLEFVYPALVLLAVAGWVGVIQKGRNRWWGYAAALVLTAGIASTAIFMVRFHPNQGVYFNALVGGPRGAAASYDMDYWGNCVLQAVEWGAETARASRVAVTISGDPPHIVRLDAQRFHEVSFCDAHQQKHYFHVDLARGSGTDIRRLWAREALYKVRTPDGAVLCTVTAGPAYEEFATLQTRHGTAPALSPTRR